MPATPPSSAVPAGASGMTARKGKPKPTWRCDLCSYETTEARNLRIHMTSEKHAHNLMVVQQNMKQMQQLSHHQMAAIFQSPQQQDTSLLGLPPSHVLGMPTTPSSFDSNMFLTSFLPGLTELPMDLTKQPQPNDISSASAMHQLPTSRRYSDPVGLFQCTICGIFSTDSVDVLQEHIQLDRSKHCDQDSIIVTSAGTFLCNLCQYKTGLKANFQLHCKTDKHLQRLQLVNHIQEGAGAGSDTDWNRLSAVISAGGSPVQVWCTACDYQTNSIYRLQAHVGLPSHEANERIFRHLQLAESTISAAVPRTFACRLCNYVSRTKLSLIQHAQSSRHVHNEGLHISSQLRDNDLRVTHLNFFAVLEANSNLSDSGNSLLSSLC